jgi:hypothetical protein
MIIITAADKNFKTYFINLIKSVNKLNYNIHVYDLGGLDYGEKYDGNVNISNIPFQKIPIKPDCIFKKIVCIKENELLVWMDSDTVLLDKIDEIDNMDFDIGITIRKEKTYLKQEGRTNAGVLFFRKNERTINFINLWIKESRKLNGDQWALNELIKNNSDQLKILKLPGEIYNNYYFNQSQKRAKIIHYKDQK